MKATADDYLSQASLLRLLAVMLLVIAPHLPRLPLWASLFAVTVVLWRGAQTLRSWRLPPNWLRLTLTLTAFAGIYASYGRASGLSAGAALLVVMLTLKLTEMQSRRDVMVTVILCHFVLVAQLLFSQEIWTLAYLFGCVIAVTAAMIEANHAGRTLSLKTALTMGASLTAQALPVMLVLFVLFPRIPGPLWGLRIDGDGARTGLSDSMSPGDISGLTNSDDIAFRVRFDGTPPPPRERYWRGPTFELFDGRRWSHLERRPYYRSARAELRGKPVSYEVTLEAHDKVWLFALDVADPQTLPADAFFNSDLEATLQKPLRKRLLYRLTSYTDFRMEPELAGNYREALLRIPDSGNPRSREWAGELRTAHADDAALADAVLATFRREKYYYTLNPPKLARDSVDDFLFNTRRGFCEHYASSFVFLMRAAGVPARVVTGYQGGELNQLGGYFVVSQSDAHAWAEIWLDGRGWTRVDPTAAVAPQRVEQGLSSAVSLADGLPAFLANRGGAIEALRLRWDWVNASWNRWVLAYGPELQQQFLSKFGLIDWQRMVLALTVIVTLVLSVLGLVLLRQAAVVVRDDPPLRHWRAAQRKLARAGFSTAPTEGPLDFVRRVTTQRPDLQAPLHALAGAYLNARYLHAADANQDAALKALVRSLKV